MHPDVRTLAAFAALAVAVVVSTAIVLTAQEGRRPVPGQQRRILLTVTESAVRADDLRSVWAEPAT
jgi:hypothetical protein